MNILALNGFDCMKATEERRQLLLSADPVRAYGVLHCARYKDKSSDSYQTRGQSGFALHQLYEDGLQDAILGGTNGEYSRP